jgi:glutathione synthase/RimK-type ligase-like ATP-grasp enzyme
VRPADNLGRGRARVLQDAFRGALYRVLLTTDAYVMNRPSHAASNYSKAFQLRQMADAGFRVPRTLVTNRPRDALRFIEACEGRAIFKGVSSVKTNPQAITVEHLAQLPMLRRCPAQFQEFIAGDDFRVTVIGDTAVASRLVRGRVDKSADGSGSIANAEVERCKRFTATQGLVVSGIDLRRTPDGRVYAFEMNAYPFFTYFETGSKPRITERVVDQLVSNEHGPGNIYI